ncbi:MAG: selenite/tellurite reduction operon c-type cytochrome lipoprotein ExtS [Desulfobacterales bacterium]
MGLRIFVVVILLGLIWLAGPHFYKGHTGCVQCHTPHFETDGTCIDCHRGDPRSRRLNIAHYRLIEGKYDCFTLPENSDVKEGRRMIDISGCRRCHKTGNRGNRLATDLDASLDKTLPRDLAHAVKYPAVFMPNFYFNEPEIARLVNAIHWSSAVWGPESGETPKIVYFEKNTEDSRNTFNKHCGSCHRVLTQQFGGLGHGNIGPNLSGIFSRFYFKNFKDGKSWDASRLKQWLNDPRDIRANAQMLPVELTEDELRHLIQILGS